MSVYDELMNSRKDEIAGGDMSKKIASQQRRKRAAIAYKKSLQQIVKGLMKKGESQNDHTEHEGPSLSEEEKETTAPYGKGSKAFVDWMRQRKSPMAKKKEATEEKKPSIRRTDPKTGVRRQDRSHTEYEGPSLSEIEGSADSDEWFKKFNEKLKKKEKEDKERATKGQGVGGQLGDREKALRRAMGEQLEELASLREMPALLATVGSAALMKPGGRKKFEAEEAKQRG